MAPVLKRLMIEAVLSTSSSGNGVALGTRFISPRSVTSALDWSSTRAVYSLKMSKRFTRVACWSFCTVRGLNRWISPSRRHWYSPLLRSSTRSPCAGSYALACRVRTLVAMCSSVMPPRRELKPGKYLASTVSEMPTASKSCEPT